ncbi:hypothetical protein MNBD_ALPHA06-1532 [hydrothermal vent metagenome]|uniref:HTH luxR-type domain-containing protein n=1 Tax=hydrothermal vent metagenome TaxID=652676 RepID=A0A3B0SPC8_9ZZZZ
MGKISQPNFGLSSDSIDAKLAEARTMYEGLNVLKNHLLQYGVGALTYGFMLHEKSYLRGDIVQYTTFPKSIRITGKQDGGAIVHRFGNFVPTMTEPLFFDMEEVLAGKGPLFSYNKTFKEIYDIGYRHAWVMPLAPKIENGFGFLMAFQSIKTSAPKLDVNQLTEFGPLYHSAMIEHKQMAKQFRLTQKQSLALANAAKGRTASYLADKLNLTERSIELRLQETRNKLSAKTTTEAAYKALVYGILPLQT